MSKKLIFPDRKFLWTVTKLMVPLMLGQMIIVSVSFIDNMMVGQTSEGALNLASVAISNEIWYFVFNVMASISIVSSIFMAQYFGRKMNKEFMDFTKNAIGLSMIFIAFCAVFIFIKPEWFLMVFTRDQAIIDNSTSFLRLITAGTFFSAISYPLQTSLNVIGKTKYVVISSAIALVTNGLFDFIFIYPMDLGAAGAGYATLLSRIIELGVVLYFSHRNKEVAYFGFNWFSFNGSLLKQLSSRWSLIATSVLFIGSLSGLSVIWTNAFDESVMQAMGTGYSVSSLMWTIFPAIGAATKVVIGHNLGRDKFDEAKLDSRKLNTSIMLIGLILSAMVAGVAFFLPQLVGLHDEARIIAKDMILIFAIANPFYVLASVLFSALEAGGISRPSVIFNNFFQAFVVVPITAVAAFATGLDFWIVFAISQFVQVLPAIAAYYYYHKMEWLNNLTDEMEEEVIIEEEIKVNA